MPTSWGTVLIFSGCYVKMCDPSLLNGALKQQRVRRCVAAKRKVNLHKAFPADFFSLTKNTISFSICDFRCKMVKYGHFGQVPTKNFQFLLIPALIVHWRQRVPLFGSGWKSKRRMDGDEVTYLYLTRKNQSPQQRVEDLWRCFLRWGTRLPVINNHQRNHDCFIKTWKFLVVCLKN